MDVVQATVELNADTFYEGTHNMSLNLFIMFYSPTCSACSNLALDFEAVAATFRSQSDLKIARLNVDAFPGAAAKYSSLGIPSFVSIGFKV